MYVMRISRESRKNGGYSWIFSGGFQSPKGVGFAI
jgi:hypothetical protein